MTIKKIYPASFVEYFMAEPGDLVFAVPETCLGEPSPRGYRREIQNALTYAWADGRRYGSKTADAGQFITAKTLFSEVPDVDRGPLIAGLLASAKLVEVGRIESALPDRVDILYSASGLKYLYGLAEDDDFSEIKVKLAAFHGLDFYTEPESLYSVESCLGEYLAILSENVEKREKETRREKSPAMSEAAR